MKCKWCKNEAVPDRVMCQSCLDKNAQDQKAFRQRRKAKGLCPDCGNPILGKAFYCPSCRKKHTEIHKSLYAQRTSMNVCGQCGKTPDEGYKLCSKCLETYSAVRKITQCNSPAYKSKARDNFICRLCGSTKRIVTHHIDGNGERQYSSRKKNPNTNDSPDNLITLCGICHSTITHLLRYPDLAIQLLQKNKVG